MALSTASIDHEGISAGRVDALEGLVAARGDSVIAYVIELAGEDGAGRAAAEAMARFRAAIGTLGANSRVETDVLLLAATRHAAAAAADLDQLWSGARIHERDPNCERMPTMLAARAVGQLNAADLERVARHLWRCEGCRLVEAAFARAEQAYRDPGLDPEPTEVEMMIAALQRVAPVTAAPAGHAIPEPEPTEPEPIEPEPIEPEPTEPEPIESLQASAVSAVFDIDAPAHEAHLRDVAAHGHDVLADEDDYVPGRSATYAFGALAMLAVLAVLGFSYALEGLPGQNDASSGAKTPTVTAPAPSSDPVPTTPATR
jgi:hypothetical protein